MEWGVSGKLGERDRVWQINGVGEGALVINENGMGQKWPLVNLNT